MNLILTFDFDLDRGRARSKVSKNSNFVQAYRVVSQIKVIGPLIPEMYFFANMTSMNVTVTS